MRMAFCASCVLAAATPCAPAWAVECPSSVTLENEKLIVDFIGASSEDYALGARAGELLRARANKFMTERYLQHHPGVEDGREAFVQFHIKWYRDHPPQRAVPVPPAAVVAHCDTVLYVHHDSRPDRDAPGKTYDSFIFDMWRIRGHKADEHWDSFLEPWHADAAASTDPEAGASQPAATAKPSEPVRPPDSPFAARCEKAQIEHNSHLIRDLERIRNGHAALLAVADRIVAPEYIERNPLLADHTYQGRAGFVRALEASPTVIPGVGLRYGRPEIVVADCTHVATVKSVVRNDYAHPGQTYVSYWFDAWRIEAGRLAEHWDATLKGVDYHWHDVDALNRHE